MSGASPSIERICHCTEGCRAAKAASRGASHNEAIVPLAEIVSTGRRRFARTASQAAPN